MRLKPMLRKVQATPSKLRMRMGRRSVLSARVAQSARPIFTLSHSVRGPPVAITTAAPASTSVSMKEILVPAGMVALVARRRLISARQRAMSLSTKKKLEGGGAREAEALQAQGALGVQRSRAPDAC